MGSRKLIFHDRSLRRLAWRERKLVSKSLVAEAGRSILSGQQTRIFIAQRLLGRICGFGKCGDHLSFLAALNAGVVRRAAVAWLVVVRGNIEQRARLAAVLL
jgi:hypothetical protein